ncbi:MAG: ATP-dependent DNA helicase [Deltaproteobacteria bacterium]|nr:ATP-dependent DNA helicase [Deltaproteobacteria bacterium]
MPDTKQLADDENVSLVFDLEGPLATALPGFHPRQGQTAMALAVARTLRQGVPLLVEAGTGTGKTLAYLAPAVLSGLKVVVSTGTRNLQDQVAGKELPLLKEALDPTLVWAVLKGRSNYLCRRRFLGFAAQPDLSLPGVSSSLALVDRWARETTTGDLDEVRGKGLAPALAGEISASSEQCLGASCPEREACWLMEARRRAAEARVVVVNHHLFLADLALKAGGHGEVLPRYQAVVFDEAHLLPDVATQTFGVEVGEHRLNVFLRDLFRELPGAAPELTLPDGPATLADQAAKVLFRRLRSLAGEAGRAGLLPAQLGELASPVEDLSLALERLADRVAAQPQEAAGNLATRARVMARDLAAAAEPAPGHSVAWVEVRGGVSLHLSPVEVGPHLQHALYEDEGRLVFTSATLAPAGDLNLFRRRLGLEPDTHTLVVPSPFDQASQALLYVPRHLPPPASPGFIKAVAQEVEELVRLSRGRAFVLFTSHRNMLAVSRLLEPRLDFTCLVQGRAPRMELLQSFVEHTPAVLFATASFWQGVDVPGPALSAVIVDKLPFAPPDDPLTAARVARLEEDGQSGFAHLMVPEAILSLKQGLGRLLRSPADRGLLAVLDVRLTTKSYGKRFLKALEPVPLTHDLGQVADFFRRES